MKLPIKSLRNKNGDERSTTTTTQDQGDIEAQTPAAAPQAHRQKEEDEEDDEEEDLDSLQLSEMHDDFDTTAPDNHTRNLDLVTPPPKNINASNNSDAMSIVTTDSLTTSFTSTRQKAVDKSIEVDLRDTPFDPVKVAAMRKAEDDEMAMLSREKRLERLKKVAYALVGGVVVMIICVLVWYLAIRKEQSDVEIIVNEKYDEMMKVLVPISGKDKLTDGKSPQYQAFTQLLFEDPPKPYINRYVLMVLYYALGGDNWTSKSTNKWMSRESECQWGGVTCSETDKEQITQLILANNNLVGSLPHEFTQLTNVQVLELDNNTVEGTIPENIEKLTTLNRLELDNNKFTGALPDSFYALTNLRVLNLEYNEFSGTLSTMLGNLKELVDFRIFENDFDGSIPSEVGNLNKLFVFHASANQLSSAVPPELFGLQGLQYLRLQNNLLGGSIPVDIQNAGSLVEMRVDNNRMVGPIPAEIGMLDSLQYLQVQGNNFTGSMPVCNIKFLSSDCKEVTCDCCTMCF